MPPMDDIKYIKHLYESEGVSIRGIMLMFDKKAQHKPRKSQSAYTIPLYLFCNFFMKPIDSTGDFVYNALVQ